MDCTKSSTEESSTYKSSKQHQEYRSMQMEQDQIILPEPIDVDLNNMPEKFYKTSSKTTSGQKVTKHGHCVYTVCKSQQDLTLFCLSLLQFEAIFPLRFFMTENKQTMEREEPEKTVWFQTQFLSLTNTTNFEITKTVKLQHLVYKFFIQTLVPVVAKFKSEKMSWNYMITEQYTDEKVIQQFREVIKRINELFRAACQALP